MPFDTPLNTNDQSFDRVLKAGLPLVTMFLSGTTDSALDDALKSLAKTNAGNLLVAKVRIDENPQLVQRYSIRAPTVITFKEGNEHSRAENPSPADVRAHADYVLGRGPKPQAAPPPRAERPQQAPQTDGKPVQVTDATFGREVLNAPLPVMVDFWAPWCGPCRMIAPALEKLAAEYAGRIRIAKLNVDDNPRTAAQYQVQGIPTLLLVKNGKVVDRIVGALPEAQLRMQVQRLLTN
ncbi:MAG TPA: thioredoxin [Anaerolineae bacterium]|nr:thioredoxin [Anaerolineae bacterium]